MDFKLEVALGYYEYVELSSGLLYHKCWLKRHFITLLHALRSKEVESLTEISGTAETNRSS